MNIKIDDYNICYKITGEGEETVLILQGWGTELSMYDSVAACINSKCRVIQLDFPEGPGTGIDVQQPDEGRE